MLALAWVPAFAGTTKKNGAKKKGPGENRGRVGEMQGREWLRTSQPPPTYVNNVRDTVTGVTSAEISARAP